jgi:hypothetical protein
MMDASSLVDQGVCRIHDALVASAPADIARQCGLYFASTGTWPLREKIGKTHHHAGKAHAALDCVVVFHRLLDWRENAARCQGLYRADRAALRQPERSQARHNRATIEQNGAGAAKAFPTYSFRSGQEKFVSQDVNERSQRLAE